MISIRKQFRLASLSAEVVGKFKFIWKHTRKYTRWVLSVYDDVAKIADKLDVKKPKPLVKMKEEE